MNLPPPPPPPPPRWSCCCDCVDSVLICLPLSPNPAPSPDRAGPCTGLRLRDRPTRPAARLRGRVGTRKVVRVARRHNGTQGRKKCTQHRTQVSLTQSPRQWCCRSESLWSNAALRRLARRGATTTAARRCICRLLGTTVGPHHRSAFSRETPYQCRGSRLNVYVSPAFLQSVPRLHTTCCTKDFHRRMARPNVVCWQQLKLLGEISQHTTFFLLPRVQWGSCR